MSECAACGKSGDGLKACTACKLVKYCNASCQRAHWPKHKKKCKKRAAELYDEALFKEPPPRDECDICMLTLPLDAICQKYQTCCGKVLCSGCIYAAYLADNRGLCPFCRTPAAASDRESIERLMKRAEGDDANAMRNLGGCYFDGMHGFPQDRERAMELWLRAGERGNAIAYGSIALAYYYGQGVGTDLKKAKYYEELAAMGGDVDARHNLGCTENDAGNMDRAVKHYMIAAGSGLDQSLDAIRQGFMKGYITKGDFEKALRANKGAKDEMRSNQREAGAAFFDAARAARGHN